MKYSIGCTGYWLCYVRASLVLTVFLNKRPNFGIGLFQLFSVSGIPTSHASDTLLLSVIVLPVEPLL